MKKQNIVLALITCVGLTLTSCYYHNWEDLHPKPVVASPCYLPTTVSYSLDIVPIINASCGVTSSTRGSSCHQGSNSASGDDFTNYTGLAGDCDPDTASSNCEVYQDITGRSGNLMPQGGPRLNSCDISKITRWITQGYPNN